MKTIHIILLLLTPALDETQAQQGSNPMANTQATAVNTPNAYYSTNGIQQANWYISTNPSTLQTSILFMDTSQRVIYEEKLPGQYVELTSHNRRILDEVLTQLTTRQLVTHKLKTKPMPVLQKSTLLSSDNLPENLPLETTHTGPTGSNSRVVIINDRLLRVWWKSPASEKVTLWVRDSMWKTLHLNTSKTDQYVDVVPIYDLAEGEYEVKLFGRTWQKKYQLHISRENQKLRYELLSR